MRNPDSAVPLQTEAIRCLRWGALAGWVARWMLVGGTCLRLAGSGGPGGVRGRRVAGWLAGWLLARSLAGRVSLVHGRSRSLAGTPSSQTCQGRPTHPRTPFTLCITPKRTLKMSFSAQPVVIDGKGHLLGRLASVVSKQVSWRRKSVDQEG